MELTEREAIDKSIELWTWCEKTGKIKKMWKGWEEYGGLNDDNECKEVEALCFLCEYSTNGCEYCPYNKKFGHCNSAPVPHSPYYHWEHAKDNTDRKKYAGLFLAQLREL